MSTSLGYRIGGDARPVPMRVVTQPLECETSIQLPSIISRIKCDMKTPTGFPLLLLYSAFAALLPTLYFYMDYDYDDMMTRAGVIGASGILAVVALIANHSTTWYNMVLFYHTAIEVKLLDTTITYANASTTDEEYMVWSWVGATIVAVHLLPFYLVDIPQLLLLLAFAGVPVNTAIAVYLDPTFLPIVMQSALALFIVTFIVVGVQGLKPSLFSKLLLSLKEGCWVM